MKIILLEDVENTGKKYEIKEVKPGFARNFLLPQKLAKIATKVNLKWLQEQKETMAKKSEDQLKLTQEMASKMDGLEVTMEVKVGDMGQLFEAINSVKISEKLEEMGFKVKKSQVDLKEPIKELGEFPVKINLDHSLETEITVIVVAEEDEKEEIL